MTSLALCALRCWCHLHLWVTADGVGGHPATLKAGRSGPSCLASHAGTLPAVGRRGQSRGDGSGGECGACARGAVGRPGRPWPGEDQCLRHPGCCSRAPLDPREAQAEVLGRWPWRACFRRPCPCSLPSGPKTHLAQEAAHARGAQDGPRPVPAAFLPVPAGGFCTRGLALPRAFGEEPELWLVLAGFSGSWESSCAV